MTRLLRHGSGGAVWRRLINIASGRPAMRYMRMLRYRWGRNTTLRPGMRQTSDRLLLRWWCLLLLLLRRRWGGPTGGRFGTALRPHTARLVMLHRDEGCLGFLHCFVKLSRRSRGGPHRSGRYRHCCGTTGRAAKHGLREASELQATCRSRWSSWLSGPSRGDGLGHSRGGASPGRCRGRSHWR